MIWSDAQPVTRRELHAHGFPLTCVAYCRTELLATLKVAMADGAAPYAAVWLDSAGEVWADYPRADRREARVRPLQWAPQQADSRTVLEDEGYAFTVIGWSC